MPGSRDLENIQLWLSSNAHAITYPVRGGRHLNVVLVTSAKAEANDTIGEHDWAHPGSAPEMEVHLTRWHKDFRSLLSYRTRWTRWPLYYVPEGGWVKGPAVLAGDAAHAMLPFAAQGAVMGIEDGAVLGRCLAPAREGAASIEMAFREFEKLRTDRVRRTSRLAAMNRLIYHLPPVAATARNLAMAILGGERLLSRQDWLYGWHPD